MANYDCSELRNRIYDFCVESGSIFEFMYRAESSLPSGMKYEFQGLTQASKQLRQEFRARYMATTKIIFGRPEQFARYASAFYPRQNLQEMQTYRGYFVLDMAHNETVEIELLEIFQLLAVAPHIRCTFNVKSDTTTNLTQINDLFAYTANPSSKTWHHILHAETRYIRITHRWINPEICFRMKKDLALKVQEWWAVEGLPSLSYWDREFRWGKELEGQRIGCIKLYAMESTPTS